MKNHLIPLCAVVYASFVLLFVAPVIVGAADNSTYSPLDIFLNCGASGPSLDGDGRNWTSDNGSKYAPSLKGSRFEAPQASSVPSVPYLTARVFTSTYTYSFPLSAGRIFIRLYFYPVDYSSSFTASDAFFNMDLWVALHPQIISKPEYYDAILNGLEVFKLQNSDNSLAGLNPPPRPQNSNKPDQTLDNNKKNKAQIGGIVGGVIGGGIVILLAIFCLIRINKRQRKKKGKDAVTSDGPSAWTPLSLYGNSHSAVSAKTNTGSNTSSLPSNLCRYFTIAEIKAATKDFDESLLLGIGGFGKVYCGEIDGGTTKVAIKRGNPMSEQGVHEFQTEIEMLSKLRHRHLVSLIETAEKCVADYGVERPSMGDVLWNLEFALQLQESAEESGNIIGGISDDALALIMAGKKDRTSPMIESSVTTTTTTTMSIGGRSIASEDSDGLTPTAVFSQIMNPNGR
ncbi:receptor-like protein kinase FERONIA [Canna indica]|uniref:Receptor-like protein kinase FERONIA n=1 Tax=Canna indica TaxID=4628 RepID=A0AAQ3KE18_9LILI|nr:receptor-like protein kinase FERONIA [Canna indica]